MSVHKDITVIYERPEYSPITDDLVHEWGEYWRQVNEVMTELEEEINNAENVIYDLKGELAEETSI